ncbi:hypothetical protein AAFF_G00434980 [Aldrovandia affinis]|uniref:Uncharacterized protein n=1 Tax=Aldrovandia affinis TaxID=143900 RepID=A0AAD7S8B0_9TELE|nr:hypothetical protein AAFF_G00434980 [Aldrovandia affinis]
MQHCGSENKPRILPPEPWSASRSHRAAKSLLFYATSATMPRINPSRGLSAPPDARSGEKRRAYARMPTCAPRTPTSSASPSVFVRAPPSDLRPPSSS